MNMHAITVRLKQVSVISTTWNERGNALGQERERQERVACAVLLPQNKRNTTKATNDEHSDAVRYINGSA